MPNNILITPGSASIQFSGSNANTIRLQVEPSGSIAFYGNSGSLFGITDSLVGSLMSVNDISGLPILEVFSDDRVVMGTYNQNTLVVTGSRVGMGTATPQSVLHVSGTVSYGSVRISPTAAAGESAIAFFTDVAGTDTNDAWVVGHAGWGNTGDFVIGNENNGAGGNVRLLIEKAGNVGIGTVSPGTLLDVNGVARATTFTSTQATGTAPFTVSSTTAVTNLNADLLDGSHASAFYLASNPSGYTTNTGTVTSVAITAGTGLSGGGTVTTSGTITLNTDLSELTTSTTNTHGDFFVVVDSADNAQYKLTKANIALSGFSNDSGYTTNTGTVTSVGGTGTVSGLTLTGTVTTTGNLTLGGTLSVAASNFSSQTANTFLAAPNGSAGTPTFRAIVAADIPTLNQNTTGTASNITAYTINQNLGTANSPSFVTVTSTQATGTAPFTVSSTTAVTNLNADYLDGQHGSYYTTAGNLTGTISSTVLGNSTVYVGTTAIALNRASTSQTLTGVSIDGNAATVTNGMYLSGDQSISGAKLFWSPAGTTFTSQASNLGLTVYQPTAGDAFMTFHIANDYAGYFGLGGAENDFMVGGWSFGGNRYKVWHSGNDGAGTGLDADLLDGNHAAAFYLASNPSGYTTNTGTVTSVGGTGTVSGLTLTGTVTTTGNLTLGGTLSVAASNFASQTANTFLAAPNGSAGVPTFRAIAAADVPTLNQNTTGAAASAGIVTGTTGQILRIDDRIIEPSAITSGYLQFGFTSWTNNNTAPYADFLHMRSYTDSSGGNDNLVLFRKDAIGIRVYQQSFGSATAYSTYKDVAFTDSNITGTATNITAYTINQNLGTTSAPTFDSVIIYDSTTKLYKSGGRLTVRSESTDDVANFATYGMYLPKTGQTAGLYVESPIEARGGIRVGSGAADGTINYGATTTNTANRMVLRDSSGNFSAGTITATLSGNATSLSTDRTNWSTNGTISAVVGQLAWKNYGNNHTIFDASAGTAPNGSAVNNTNPQVNWTGNYPTLMGWNGTNTYGVRVDSARVADSAAVWTTARTITIGSTGKSVDGSGNVSWTLAEIGAYSSANPSGYTTNTGTVTSVGGTGTVSGLTLSGTVTTTGNLTLGGTLSVAASNFASQTANTFLAAPNGSAGVPTFRAIAAADVPTLNQNTTGTASNITAYTINQNLGTSNSPQWLYIGVNPAGASNNGYGISLYGGASTSPTYGIFFQGTSTYGTHGNVTADWATYFTMDSTVNRGWIFRNMSSSTNVASINNAGYATFASLGVGTAGSGTSGEIRATNEITAYYSDERLKDFHGTITNAGAKVAALNGYYFTENTVAKSLGYNNDKLQVGVSAQEVQAVLPEAVTAAPISDEYLTVRYEKIVPLLIEAIKELQAEIAELKRQS